MKWVRIHNRTTTGSENDSARRSSGLPGLSISGSIFLALLSILLGVQPASAQSTGCTINASNANLSTVQNALNSAVPGATVCVPQGSATWSGTLTFPSDKDVTLQGAGSGVTVINCGSGNCLAMNNSSTQRLTGFTFNWTGGNQYITVHGPVAAGKSFRIDHNSFNAPNATWSLFNISGDGPVAKHPTGLIDNNTFLNFGIHINGTNFMLNEANTQHVLWSQPSPLGSGADVVYIEDNVMTSAPTAGFQNFFDGNYGARYVVRFNTLNGHGTGVEIHSVQGNNRAVHRWEIYGNSLSKNGTSWYPVAFVRGGTGVAFGNTASASFTNDFVMDNVRSERDPGDGVGACNGSSNWDQNTSGMQGYACRDQVGRGGDNSTWSPGNPYSQPLMPAYFWNNFRGGSPMSVVIASEGRNAIHLVANRDWYAQTNSFSGASGVGSGPRANRPASCTAGVAYWASDEGEWNSKQAGADGQLYKCTSANVWTLYYKPYVYPHPLQGQTEPPPPPSDTTAPSTPTNVSATSVSSSQVNLSWTASTDNVGVSGYAVERCQGAGCTNFAQAATPAGTTYSDTGLLAATTYRYRVRAADAAGNLSPYSTIASATTAAASDTTAPSTPTNLSATSISSSQISLTWTASTDNVGVSEYRVERCQGAGCTNFVQVAAPTGTTYSDTGLTAGTTYLYRVRAADAAGNLSAYSSTASATTQAAADTSAPSTPANLSAASVSPSQINLSWNASMDNVGVATYRLQRCKDANCTNWALIASPTGTSYSDTALAANTTYRYRVRAVDAAGNVSPWSSIASAVTLSGNKFNVGDRIILVMDTLARSEPSVYATRLGTHYIGELGTIVGGPVEADTYTWWQIDYDTNPDGWSGDEDRFEKFAGADTVPPVISITTPTSGSDVSGDVPVSADASDNVGVAGVTFLLDGSGLGPEVTAAPYSLSWNTANIPLGAHTLTAVARDEAGNRTTSAEVSVNVTKFKIGDRIILVMDTLARTTPSVYATRLGTHLIGELGTIIGGPVAADTYTWWQIDYDQDPDGWSGDQDRFERYVVSSSSGAPASSSEPVTFNIPEDGGVNWTVTGSTSQDSQYARIEMNPASQTRSGVLILAAKAGSTLITEAAIPATETAFSGRLHVQNDGTIRTSVSLANPGTQDAVVSFYFTDTAGTDSGQGSFTLAAGRQVSAFLDQSPFNGRSPWQGTFTFSASAPVRAAALRTLANERGEFLMTNTPVVEPRARNGTVILPHFSNGGGWTTDVILTNPTDGLLEGTVQFYGPGKANRDTQPLRMSVNGKTRFTFAYTIQPRSFVRLVTEQLSNTRQSGSVQISPSVGSAPTAVAIVSLKNSGITITQASVEGVPAGTAFQLYSEVSGPSGQPGSIEMNVAIANPSATSATVYLNLAGLDGSAVGETVSLTIPAHGRAAPSIRILYPGLPANFQGILRLTAPSPISVSGLRGRYNDRSDYLMTAVLPRNEAQTAVDSQLFLSPIFAVDGYTSQFVVFGPPGSGKLWLYSGGGEYLPGRARQNQP